MGRMDEIRERLEAHERGVKGAAHDDEASDLRWLLSEIDRLREAEAFVRMVAAQEPKEITTPHGALGALVERARRLKAKLEGEDEQD